MAVRPSSRSSTPARCARSPEADRSPLDRHKWLFVPVEAALVLVRDAEGCDRRSALVPPYIRQSGSAGEVYGLPWFSEYGFSRRAASRAEVWMTLQQFGFRGYREIIEENLALAGYLAARCATPRTSSWRRRQPQRGVLPVCRQQGSGRRGDDRR